MNTNSSLKDALKLHCSSEVDRICDVIRSNLRNFRKQGIVVALSGGIDSSVTAALCVKAVGPNRVFGIHMPDKDSSDDTLSLSQSISKHYTFDSVHEDITSQLEAAGCYRRQVESIQKVLPEYRENWKSKISLQSSVSGRGVNFFNIVAQSPDGETITKRLNSEAYLGVVAATNFKQRIRKMMEYYHADRLNFAVSGTPNRLEYDQGFFVKLGDGAADIKPIAHLYKTQVYELAEFLDVPEHVRKRPPTTDTYSLPQGQDEFYFALPHGEMDVCLYAKNHGINPGIVAEFLKMDEKRIESVFHDIDQKRSTTKYLHAEPILVEKVNEIV